MEASAYRSACRTICGLLSQQLTHSQVPNGIYNEHV